MSTTLFTTFESLIKASGDKELEAFRRAFMDSNENPTDTSKTILTMMLRVTIEESLYRSQLDEDQRDEIIMRKALDDDMVP